MVRKLACVVSRAITMIGTTAPTPSGWLIIKNTQAATVTTTTSQGSGLGHTQDKMDGISIETVHNRDRDRDK